MVKITHTHGQKAKETGKKSSANKAKRKKIEGKSGKSSDREFKKMRHAGSINGLKKIQTQAQLSRRPLGDPLMMSTSCTSKAKNRATKRPAGRTGESSSWGADWG